MGNDISSLLSIFNKEEYNPESLGSTIKRDTVSANVDNVRGILSSVYRGLVNESIIFPQTGE